MNVTTPVFCLASFQVTSMGMFMGLSKHVYLQDLYPYMCIYIGSPIMSKVISGEVP